MKDIVKLLQEGCYENLSLFLAKRGQPVVIDNNNEIHLKKPVDCNKLFPHSIKMTNEKFIPMCAGITGSISSLIADKGHQADHRLAR
jgi:hypothetical protein